MPKSRHKQEAEKALKELPVAMHMAAEAEDDETIIDAAVIVLQAVVHSLLYIGDMVNNITVGLRR